MTEEKHHLLGYEKIRSVGKGAFGNAFVYKKRASDRLVVIKQINLIQTSSVQRQMALNEVHILSLLHHQNIIRSFELDGSLMIEMEYADGGTLAEYLKIQTQALREKQILIMFSQIVSAVRYIHERNILHRDLKTANVFLTKSKKIKVGDFGISRIMNTEGQAETILGTPYYISPEMCEGKLYDEKSDIWALGCILYEMACLQKTFEGTNLLVLVNKITKGQFQLPTGYSKNFLNLLLDLLQTNPKLRPTASKIEDEKISKLLEKIGKLPSENRQTDEGDEKRSVLYKFQSFKSNFCLLPIETPAKTFITQVTASNTHCIALTSDETVLTWGSNENGELGHGDRKARKNPSVVEDLIGKKIKLIGAGDGFSLFVTHSGMAMTCGNGRWGCLGHGHKITDLNKPKLLDKLLNEDVVAMFCGSYHVVVKSRAGVVYSWGKNSQGCLGLGDVQNIFFPVPVSLPKSFAPRMIRCGTDCTVLIGTDGSLMACGNNSYNKLGTDKMVFGLFSKFRSQKEVWVPQKVCCISSNILDVTLGATYTLFLSEDGRVLSLGVQHQFQIKKMTGNPVVENIPHRVKMIQSGSTFSLATTLNNTVWFWGTFFKGKNEKGAKSLDNFKCSTSFLHSQPTPILGLFSSPEELKKKRNIRISGIYVFQQDILLLVETSTPLLKESQDKQKHKYLHEENVSDWIKSEFMHSVTPSLEYCSNFKFK